MIDLVIPALPLPLISAACPPSCDPLCPIYALPSSFHQFKLHLIQSRLYGYLLTITIHPHHFTISLPTFHFLLLINEKTSPYSPRDTFLARPVYSVCSPFTSSPPLRYLLLHLSLLTWLVDSLGQSRGQSQVNVPSGSRILGFYMIRLVTTPLSATTSLYDSALKHTHAYV